VAESVTKATGEYYSLEDAKENIKDYFTKFSRLKKWLEDRKNFIQTNGYTYSFFGRKRRLPNVFSTDKGIAAHEVRSGINAEVQSLASDVNLLGAMRTAEEVAAKGLDAKIFMLVHDSIVALVKDECVVEYCEILKRNTQHKWGCEIANTPIGVDQDIGEDYSFGDFIKTYQITESGLARI
jgi:DNA polymerase-1